MPLVVSSNQSIFNPPSGSKATDNFPHFGRLPLELRWTIWELELKHERLLHVEADPLELPVDDDGDAEIANPTGITYKIILTEFRPISKLTRVNSESRAVASWFYRVQLPCVYRWEGKEDTDGIFYFNPELDTLEIRGKAFSNFAEDLWVHDTRHVGLVNLSLSSSSRPFRSRSSDDLFLLQKVICRLKRVVFLYLGGLERMFLGEPRTTNCMDKAEVYRSRPIMPAIPKFDRLPYDPRSHLKTSLKKVYLDCSDPRTLVHSWFRLMTKCNIQHNHKVDYRFLVAFGGRKLPHRYNRENRFAVAKGWRGWRWRPRGYDLNPEITNRDAAISWVQRKDETWREMVRETREELDDLERNEEEEQEEEGNEELAGGGFQELELPLQPAIGFWLFPIEALGPLPDITKKIPWNGVPVPDWKSHRKIDLSGYKPQLCLSYLP